MAYATNNVRIVTAAALFDGHDAAINIKWPYANSLVSARDNQHKLIDFNFKGL